MTKNNPYDPALVLGNIVDRDTIEALQKIAEKQAPIDQARDRVNALLRMKLSLDMTQRELISLGGDTDEIDAMIVSADQQIKQAAEALAREVIKAQS